MPNIPVSAIEAKAHRIVQRLRDRHRIGQLANRSKLPIEEFANKHALSTSMVRKLKRFATAYSPVDGGRKVQQAGKKEGG